jgi:tetratricopeptide (TPR) repeat protein
MDREETLLQAKKLRQADELEESQELLLALLEEYPDDPQVLFEVGGAFDIMGFESEAIPYYQQAIDAGLEGAELHECLICLGSSYRNVGEFDQAVEVLESATDRYPENKSSRAFLALAYYSDEQYEDAVRVLMDLLLETTDDDDILAYADTLDFYKDNLDEVWDDE